MKLFHGVLGLAAICVVVVLLSLLGLISDFVSGLIAPHITMDGLLLALICLLMGGLFTLMLVLIAKDAGWLDWLPALRKKAAPEAAANPAKPAATAPASQPASPPTGSASGQEK